MSMIDDIKRDAEASLSSSTAYDATARRIARIPEMEAALIAAEELDRAYGLYRSRPAMDDPDDWRRMDEALAAYRAATGGDA